MKVRVEDERKNIINENVNFFEIICNSNTLGFICVAVTFFKSNLIRSELKFFFCIACALHC